MKLIHFVCLGLVAGMSSSFSFAGRRKVIELPEKAHRVGNQNSTWDCGANSAACNLAAAGAEFSYDDFRDRCPRFSISVPILANPMIQMFAKSPAIASSLAFKLDPEIPIGPAPSILSEHMSKVFKSSKLTGTFHALDGQNIGNIIQMIDADNPPHVLIKVGDNFGFPMIHYVWVLGYDEDSKRLAYRDPSGGNGSLTWVDMAEFQHQWHFTGGYAYDSATNTLTVKRENGTSIQTSPAAQAIDLRSADFLPVMEEFFKDSGQEESYGQIKGMVPFLLPMAVSLTGGKLEIQIKDFPTGSCFGKSFEAKGGTLVAMMRPASESSSSSSSSSAAQTSVDVDPSEDENLAKAIALSLSLDSSGVDPD